MNQDWLMLPSEVAKWNERLSGDWPLIVWRSIGLSGALIGVYLVLVYLTVAGIVPALRGPFRLTPVHSIFLFLASSVAAAMAHSAIFSSGVIAYWINQTLPSDQLIAISQWTFKHLTFFGWAFG